jgi:IS5 family transposase
MLGSPKKQMSFVDSCMEYKMPAKAKDYYLDKINKIIDWLPIEKALNTLYTSERGRQSKPPLVMFKMLLIQSYYHLSDPELELAVADRISFRRFVGISFEESVPDETTVVRFRQRLGSANMLKGLLEEINRQLSERNLIVRTTTLVDATLVESAAKRPAKNGESKDPDSGWTVKRRQIHYGYKAHISVDYDNGLVEKAVLTPASIHDSKVFEELIPENTKSVFADKAYPKASRKHALRAAGIFCGILDKSVRNHKLTAGKIKLNKHKSVIRSNVERVFAHWKRWFGYEKVRYFGLSKNDLQLQVLAIAYNLKRSAVILKG